MPCVQGTAADRQRRRRQRRAAGLAVLQVEVPLGDLADALVGAGWLGEWDSENQAAVEAAVARLLAHLSRVTA